MGCQEEDCEGSWHAENPFLHLPFSLGIAEPGQLSSSRQGKEECCRHRWNVAMELGQPLLRQGLHLCVKPGLINCFSSETLWAENTTQNEVHWSCFAEAQHSIVTKGP